jgi:hypothetical protein
VSDHTDKRYPLSWPSGWLRSTRRSRAAFKHHGGQVSVAVAIGRLQAELDRLGGKDAILSTNLQPRLDGLPYSNQPEPVDRGVACYFKLKGQPRVLACDRWDRVADNIVAIAQHIDALRRIDRYGVGSLEQAFAGYKPLPANASPWWEVLEFSQRPELWRVVEAKYIELAKKYHPDRDPAHAARFANINAARDAARIDLEGTR